MSAYRFALMVGLAACGGASQPGSDGGVAVADLSGSNLPGDLGSTWTAARGAVFYGCSPTESGCHATVANFYPGDRSTMVNVPSQANPKKLRVRPGDPAASLVWQKLNNLQGVGEGTQMPPYGWGSIDAAQIEMVRRWIAEGALDN